MKNTSTRFIASPAGSSRDGRARTIERQLSVAEVQPHSELPGRSRTLRTVISDRLEKLVEEMVDKGVRLEDAVREFEKRFISRILRDTDGSLTKTACALGMHRNTLSRKMDEYKIKRRAG